MFRLIRHATPAGVDPAREQRIVDLGLLGVNRPARSRQSRIITHNLNDETFRTQYTGQSPVSWRLNGEFTTNGGLRIDSTGTQRTALNELALLDQWSRDGIRFEVQQTSGESLGFARIRAISESGDVMGNQTLSTRWSITLLFDYNTTDRSTGGTPAIDVADAPGTVVGGAFNLPPGSEPGEPGTGTGTGRIPIIRPQTPQQPAGDVLSIALTNVSPGVPVDLSNRALNAFGAPFTYTDPADPDLQLPVSAYELVVSAIDKDAQQDQSMAYGYYLWLEQWDGSDWIPLERNTPWRFYAQRRSVAMPGPTQTPIVPGEESTYGFGWTFTLGPGTVDTWMWVRARQRYKTIGAAIANRIPAPTDTDYNAALVSNQLGIYWGEYIHGTSAPPVPPAAQRTGTGQMPLPRVRRVHVSPGWAAAGAQRSDYLAVRWRPRQRVAGDRAIYELPLSLETGARRLRIPRLAFTYEPQTTGVRATAPQHDIQIQAWIPAIARGPMPNTPPPLPTTSWVDYNDGYWLVNQRYVSYGMPSGRLGSTTSYASSFDATGVNNTEVDENGSIDMLRWTIVWLRAKYDEAGDIFYSHPVGFVWPPHITESYYMPPSYPLDP